MIHILITYNKIMNMGVSWTCSKSWPCFPWRFLFHAVADISPSAKPLTRTAGWKTRFQSYASAAELSFSGDPPKKTGEKTWRETWNTWEMMDKPSALWTCLKRKFDLKLCPEAHCFWLDTVWFNVQANGTTRTVVMDTSPTSCRVQIGWKIGEV